MSEATKAKEMDMLNGKLAGKLILFAIPLAFSSILQQLFNSADVAVVGRFAGSNALAAVGSCVALVGIFVNLIVGLAVGPNAALANLIGQNKREKISGMLHTILTFGAVLGIVLMGVGMLTATGERYGRCTVIHPDLFPGTSLYGDLQLWSSDSQKLWGYKETIVLSDHLWNFECNPEPAAGDRISSGCSRCCHCNNYFQYGQYGYGYLLSASEAG